MYHRSFHRALWLLSTTCFSVLFLSGYASAQPFEELRSLAMQGAVRADASGNSAVLRNPAGVGRAYQYGAEVQYFRASKSDLNMTGINVVDSKTQPALAMGLSYGYLFSDSGADVEIEGHDGRLAFSHAIVPNELSIGVGLHYLTMTRRLGDGAADDVSGFTLDVGINYGVGMFRLGLVGENLVDFDDPLLPRRAGGGVALTGGTFTFEVDVLADFDTADTTKPVFSTGLELLLAEMVPLRVSYERDQARELSYVGGGLGFIATSGASKGTQINLSYRQNLDDSEDNMLGAGMTFFL